MSRLLQEKRLKGVQLAWPLSLLSLADDQSREAIKKSQPELANELKASMGIISSARPLEISLS
jgi:hypothetical protein